VAKQEALVAQAEASLLKASGDLRRAQSVDVAGAIAPQKVDEYRATEASSRAALASARADLRSARLKLAQTRIVAPDAGVVATRSGVVGNVVSSGTELYRLIRQGRIEWRAELDAKQLAQVRAGQTARVVLPSGQAVAGKVRLVSPALSTTTGRGTVYVSLMADGPAKVGVFASGTIELQQAPALTLPEAAVVLRDGRSYVYTAGTDGKAASRPVTTGRRQGDRVEVVAGLDADTRVVAKGGAFLSDGAQVTVAAATGAAGEGARK
jgi:RND family efflux transporter MFP subunit